MNSGNETSNIEIPIDEALSFHATLGILYIYPNNSHVQFWRHFDDSWFECKKTSLKICVDLMMNSTILELIGISVFSNIYGISMILSRIWIGEDKEL